MSEIMMLVTILGFFSGLTFAASKEEKMFHPRKIRLRRDFLTIVIVLAVVAIATSLFVDGTWPFLDVDTERSGVPSFESILIFLAQGSGTGAIALIAGYGLRILGRFVRGLVRTLRSE